MSKANIAELSTIDQVSTVQMVAPTNTVILKPGGFGSAVNGLPTLKKYSFDEMRKAGPIMLGGAKVDLAPILSRKGALPLLAQQLQARPGLATVNYVDVQAVENAKGLVIRSFLNYQLKTGACSDTGRRTQVRSLGLECATRMGMSDAELNQAFSTPGNVHYVRDPQLRAQAIARAKRDAQLQQAEVREEVANFRAAMANGANRQAVIAEIGESELQRLLALGDDDLAAELINSSENKVEQVMFVPKLEVKVALANGKLAALLVPSPPPPPPPPPQPIQVSTDTPVEQATFLTGFTLGREYEWDKRVEKTIKWCVVGCKKHYHVHAYAHFGYGFGLRFPIHANGNYHYQGQTLGKQTSNESAAYTPQFSPFNGQPGDYTAAGLPTNKVFAGKELVAEVSAGAGFDAHIPIYPDPPSLSVDAGIDFTDYLPGKFKGGNIAPPNAGDDLTESYVFDTIDLLGGRLNFGIVGAQVFPMVDIGLHGDGLTFDLHDKYGQGPGGPDWKGIKSGQTIPIGVGPNSTSDFTIDNPNYTLSFEVTPGVDARLFIDLGVWSHTWDWQAKFPELAIKLPPGGLTFSCHEGTTCFHRYVFSTIGGATVTGEMGAMLAEINGKGDKFDAKWLPQCQDDTCQFGVKLVRLNAVLLGKQALGVLDAKHMQPDGTKTPLSDAEVKDARTIIGLSGGSNALYSISAFGKADATAQLLVNESIARKTAKAVDSFSVLAAAVWTKKCKDADCVPEISALAKKMGPRAQQVQAQNIDYSSLQVTGIVGKEFAPQFQAAIDRSSARAGVDGIATLAEAVWTKQCLDDLCRTNVTLLAGKMSLDARALQKQTPDMSGLELSGALGKTYGKLFQREIDASKLRVASPKPIALPHAGTATHTGIMTVPKPH